MNFARKTFLIFNLTVALACQQAYSKDSPHSVDVFPPDLTPSIYSKAVEYVNLASQTYDWDDYAATETWMKLFGGIDDIVTQDFSTPTYKEISASGNGIDWWGGEDEGLDYKVFEDATNGNIVIAYRGSEPLSAEDWVEDIEQVFGSSEQYQQAIAFARESLEKINAYNALHNSHKTLSFTGHSLGGGLATASALATGCEAIVFDAAGLSEGTIKNNQLDTKHATRIINFNVKGDIVSDWNGKMDNTTIGTNTLGVVGKPIQYGKVYWLKDVNGRGILLGGIISDAFPPAKLSKQTLNHTWHVVSYQLKKKQFVHSEP